jgi:heavy metal sensor kinase
MSLRLRLTLLYSTLSGGTLLLFGAVVYGLVSFLLTQQFDQTLTRQVNDLIKVLRVNEFNRFEARTLLNFQPINNDIIIQIWGNDRRLQLARPASWQDPLDDAARRVSAPQFNSTNSNNIHVRVLSVPLRTDRAPVGTLQVGISLSLLDTAQYTLAMVSVSVALLAMVASALLAWFATGRALAPLAAVTQVATTITKADDLSRRIPQAAAPENEIGQLIQAFNETLSRLENLFNTQRRFVADVSHELRTPLTVIKGELALMRRMRNADEESLKSAESEVDRLTRLVGDLLLLAQAESGRLPLDLKSVELDTILLEVFQQMKVVAGEKVHMRISSIDQVQVTGDRDRLKQVLVNLVGNAVQYTPPGGQVALSLDRSDNQARILVTDSGPGISPKDLPHIFERFYRGEKSRKRGQGSGFGLGLSIAYWIVRNHNGRIEVNSREGQGTTFCVWLPLKR